MASDAERINSVTAANRQSLTFRAVRRLLTIYVLLVFLGFPGTLSNVIGSGPAKLLETVSFGLQFVLIALASGEDVMSIKLLNINYAYLLIYLYLLYIASASLLVSIDRKMVLTSVIHLSLTAMFALWLIDQFPMEELLEMFYSALVIYIGLMLIGMVVFSRIVFYSYGGSRTFRGFFATKNECGGMLSLGIIIQAVLFQLRKTKKKRIGPLFAFIFGVQFIMLILTKNMGSLLVVLIALGYIFFYIKQKKKKRLPLCLLFIVISIGFLFFALTILQMLEPFLNSLGKDASLTGRVPLWQRAIEVMQNNQTLTGYGYLMFWRTPKIVALFHSGFAENSWAATSSASMHNMIIELWCDTGLLGVGFLFLMLLGADRGIKHLEEEQYMFSSAFLIMFTVKNLTERGMMPDSLYTMVFFLVLAMMYHARFQAKLKRMKKARIYKAETTVTEASPEKENDNVPDWFVFQKKFSNSTVGLNEFADLQKKDYNRKEDEEEEEKEESELDTFYKGLYDDEL